MKIMYKINNEIEKWTLIKNYQSKYKGKYM